MLSLTEGNPIAKIVDSTDPKFKSKNGLYKMIGYIETDEDKPRRKFKTPYKMMSAKQILKNKYTTSTKKLQEEFKKKEEEDETKEKTYFTIHNGYLQPMPDTNKERECIYITAPSGSGKSYFARMFLDNYKEIYPENRIIIFSLCKEDPAFDGLEYELYHVNRQQFIEDYENDELYDINDLNNCCVVFDDIDSLSKNKMSEWLYELRALCLETGRKKEITVLCTSHIACNNKKTEVMINESDSIVVFPKKTLKPAITRMLCIKHGFDKSIVDTIEDLPSRWCMIHIRNPQYILTKDEIILL